MNKYFGIVAIVFLASCAQEDLASKKSQLDAYREELTGLEEKIKALEGEINELDTTKKEVVKLPLVKVKELQPEKFEHFFKVNGLLEAKENVMISPEMGGTIDKIFVKEGDRVSPGTKIAKLNTSILERSIDEVNTGLKLATTVFERQERLWEQKIGSEIQFLEAKSNKESLENKLATLNEQLKLANISANTSGVIDMVFKKEGELGAPGVPIVQLVNPKKLKIKADVSESYAANVKKGDIVYIDFPNFNKTLEAPIDWVSSQINPGNRTFSIQVNIENPDEYLKPNALAEVKVTDYQSNTALVVPSIIVSKDGRGEFVFVAENTEGKIVSTKTYIKTGKSGGGRTEVIEGLSNGQKVIVEGYTEVANGDEVETKS